MEVIRIWIFSARSVPACDSWTRYFIAAQGYNVKDNRKHQYNKSSIVFENTGKALISKRTKHINITYFFITGRVKNGEVSVVWCPTGDIIGEYMSKRLQGAMFINFRDQIMGLILAKDTAPRKVKVEQLRKA